jgi:hypothetical protein
MSLSNLQAEYATLAQTSDVLALCKAESPA